MIRQAKALGIPDADIKMYARVAARSGIRISFSKDLNAYTKNDGTTGYGDGFYDPKSNAIVVNPEGKRSAGKLLMHELSHALYSYKKYRSVLDKAKRRMDEAREKEIKANYEAAGESDAVISEELAVHHAEDVLGSKSNLERVVEEEPNIKSKILSFFRVAKTAYGDDSRLSLNAGRLYKHFEKAFNDFAARNKRNLAAETVTLTNSEKTQVSADGKRYAVDETYADYDKPINIDDVAVLRSVSPVSVNQLDSNEIKKVRKWAYKFYRELGVKSPFFRSWFGDWREYDNGNVNIVSVPTIEISQATLARGNYIIGDTGWEVYAGTTLNDDTRHHSGGNRVNVKSLGSIEEILHNAVLLDTIISEPNTKKKSKNTAFLHKLYTIITYEHRTYIAKTTIEEYYNETEGGISKRAYNLKAIKIEPAGGQLGISSSSSVPDASSTISISDLFAIVKQYDKEFSPKPVSEHVLNDDGTPKVFYHGTSSEFYTFEKGHKRTRGRLNFGNGFYFTPKRSMAGVYAEGENARVVEAYVALQNPYAVFGSRFDQSDLEAIGPGVTIENVAEHLQALGYDGIVARNYNGIENPVGTVISFDAAQIKSASTGADANIGTFDSSNPDIRRALPDTTEAVGKARKEYKPSKKESFYTAKDRAYIEAVDELYGISKYLRKFGGLDKDFVDGLVQFARASISQAQTMIGQVQYNIFSDKPEKVGDGLLEIRNDDKKKPHRDCSRCGFPTLPKIPFRFFCWNRRGNIANGRYAYTVADR